MSDLPTKDLSKPRTALIIGFALLAIATILTFRLVANPEVGGDNVDRLSYYPLLIGSWFIGVIVFHVALGMLARRQGKSPIIWAGLSFLSSPLGPFVAFPAMLFEIRNTNKKIAQQSAPD